MLADSFLENQNLNHLLAAGTPNLLYSTVSVSITANPLQVICATSILKSRDVFERHVESLAPNIYPFLLQLAIEQNYIQYMKNRRLLPIVFGHIGLLIEYWPYQELILREHLSFKQDHRSYPECRSLHLKKKTFLRFIKDLIEHIIGSFMQWNNTQAKNQTLIKLNVAQLGFSIEEFLLNRLTSFVKEAQNSNLQSRKRSLELVCDITINDSRKFPEFLSRTLPPLVKRESNLPLTLAFETITIDSVPESLVTTFLNFMLNQEKPPNYLKICMCPISQEFLEYLRMKFSSLKGLAVKYISTNLFDFSPLSNFNHLRQLDVSGTSSKDGWGILGQLPCDLHFLRMVGCKLKSSDFIFLLRHANTLLQVDLSENSMAGADVYPALFEFISGLHNVEILALECCQLGQIPLDPFKSFIDDNFATSCSKLKVLQLNRNAFFTNFIPHILTSIVEKKSLTLLSLTVPWDVYMNNNNKVFRETKFRFTAAVEACRKPRGSTLRIDWGKETNFNHWYYGF